MATFETVQILANYDLLAPAKAPQSRTEHPLRVESGHWHLGSIAETRRCVDVTPWQVSGPTIWNSI